MEDSGSETDKVSEFVLFQIKRRLTNSTVEALEILEEFLKLGYPIDYQFYRKRLLDHNADRIKESEEMIKKLQIKLK